MVSKYSIPRAANTYKRPCAAPERSTLLPSDFRVSNNQGTKSGKFSSPIPLIREPMALAATERTSGIGSRRTFLTSGRSNPI
nr:hypothetical protein Iba_chr03eCG8580 [Ipomoea batatas]